MHGDSANFNEKSLKCAVHVLYALSTSTALGEGIGLVCPKFLIFLFITHMCSIVIPTCKGSFCCLRNLARCMSLSPFSYAYPRDSEVKQAVKNVSASYAALVDLFGSIESFLSRLDIYTKILLTAAMTGIVIKIMVEVLTTLALATK